jgi:hypothetical protein
MSCWLVFVSVKVMTTGWPVAHPIIGPAGFLPAGGGGGLAGAAGGLAGVVTGDVLAGPVLAGAAAALAGITAATSGIAGRVLSCDEDVAIVMMVIQFDDAGGDSAGQPSGSGHRKGYHHTPSGRGCYRSPSG